jgi:hypothetical protein
MGASVGAHADQMNAIDKYVVSRLLAPSDMAVWNNSTLLSSGDFAGEVAALKAQTGGEIHLWGSAELVRYLVGEQISLTSICS